jgi:hypothetical protein
MSYANLLPVAGMGLGSLYHTSYQLESLTTYLPEQPLT